MSQEFDAVASKYMIVLLGIHAYIHTHTHIYMQNVWDAEEMSQEFQAYLHTYIHTHIYTQNVWDEEEMSQEFDAVASKYMIVLLGVHTYTHTRTYICRMFGMRRK